MELFYSLIAAFIVSAISFVGIFILLKRNFFKGTIITGLISFAAGTLIGDAFLHLLPEHIETYGYEHGVGFIFLGMFLMLVIEAYFHCSHDSSDQIEHFKKADLAKINLFGDGLHNFLDGLAIASSFLINPATGIASTIAIILHEIPQEIADTAVLSYSGWRRAKILIFNFLTALTAIAGVVLVFVINSFSDHAEQYLIPITIGQFIYIALADLMPEIHKKAGVKKYIIEISMFVLGIGVMYLLTLTE